MRSMPRKTLIRSTTHPYHVTARANNREAFPCDLSYLWQLYDQQLTENSKNFGSEIHAFVLMPNHFHLLISTPSKDLGVVMQHLMRSITKIVNKKSQRSGRIFGAKYHWSLVGSEDYLDVVLKYIYRNPVKAKLTSRAEEYTFSTLKNLVANKDHGFKMRPLYEHNYLSDQHNLPDFLRWLNTPFNSEHEDGIKKGLLKTNFAPPKVGWKKQLMDLSTAKFDTVGIEKSSDTAI